MLTLTIQEVQYRLPELIADLQADEDILITRDAQPVARLRAESVSIRRPRRPGSAKGILTIISDDDHHLKDFG